MLHHGNEEHLRKAINDLVASCDSMMTDLQPSLIRGDKKRVIEIVVDHAVTSYQIITVMKSKTGVPGIPVMNEEVSEDIKHALLKILLNE